MKVLVVGGSGFIGRRILALLARSDLRPAALDLHRPEGMPDRIDWSVGSADDPAVLAATAGGCEAVIFLAASSLPATANADVAAEVSTHVRMVVQAAEACCRLGVKRFIFASSGGTVYGAGGPDLLGESDPTRPLNAYGVSKLAIEHYLRVIGTLRGMTTISLRVSNPFGPGQLANRGQGFIAAAMSACIGGKVLPCWGDGSAVRDFIYIDDVAEAFVRACRYEGESAVFNIGSGVGRSLKTVIAAIEAVTGRALAVEYSPGRIFDVPRNVLDVSLAARELPWRPTTGFEEGLGRTAAWWVAQVREP